MHEADSHELARHELEWGENDTPVSVQFGDPYFSRSDGRAETQHVFLAGNDLPHRWQSAPQFTIAELGFGTGLNFFETLNCWRRNRGDCATLTYIGFERFPMAAPDMRRALARWPELSDDAARIADGWPPESGWSSSSFDNGLELKLCIGDANAELPLWPGLADAWYLDGFSPAKNPELWGASLLQEVFDHTHAGGTFSTFTSAGWVRRNLAEAGFEVFKAAGFGRKRENLRGFRPEM